MIVAWNGKYLMIKDDYKTDMTFPSGVVDPDESPRHTALRESYEETGLRFEQDDVAFYSVCYIRQFNGFKDRFHFYFYTEIDDMQAEKVVVGKGVEYFNWVEPSEIAQQAGRRRAYVKLQDMLVNKKVETYFEV